MRYLAGGLFGIAFGLYLMYWMYPLLSTEHTAFNNLVNASDPVIVNSYNMGQGFYYAIPFIPFLVWGFLLIAYAQKRSAVA